VSSELFAPSTADGGLLRNGVEIKVQIDAHLLPPYFLFFWLNSWAIRPKKQKIWGQNLKPECVPLFQHRSLTFVMLTKEASGHKNCQVQMLPSSAGHITG
jgi:hypothetical protein